VNYLYFRKILQTCGRYGVSPHEESRLHQEGEKQSRPVIAIFFSQTKLLRQAFHRQEALEIAAGNRQIKHAGQSVFFLLS
jgi:hypothetical protein